jgi:hypothetical protein
VFALLDEDFDKIDRKRGKIQRWLAILQTHLFPRETNSAAAREVKENAASLSK